VTHDDTYPRLTELVGLHDAFDGEPALRRHIASCSKCARRLADLEGIDATLREMGADPPLPQALEAEVKAVPEAYLQTRKQRRGWIPAAGAFAIAATVAALLVVPRVGSGPDARVIALSSAGSAVHGTLRMTEHTGGNHRIRLEVTGLARAPGARYRLWLRSGTGEVALEPFRPGVEGTTIVVMDVPADRWTHATITAGDAPPGGASTIVAGQF
jgi:hypothetical protein